MPNLLGKVFLYQLLMLQTWLKEKGVASLRHLKTQQQKDLPKKHRLFFDGQLRVID